MKFTRNTLLAILLVATTLLAFTTSVQNQRTIEGRIIDQLTKKPIATYIIITRKGRTWYVKSTEEGRYSITLEADKAYALKIYNETHKKYINAIFLADETNNQSFNYNIELVPEKE
jgi:hypothetical protein